jgi:uncharacterized membrane protein YsdA (DUF1294 family)
MIAIVLILLMLPALVLRGLRHGCYVLHVACVAGMCAAWYKLDGRLANLSALYYDVWLLSGVGFIFLVSINAVTFIAYAWDKRAAKRHAWRIPERTLHALALIGGTPSALLAMRILRHKNKKKSFRMRMWAICAVQVSLLAFFFAKLFHVV